MTAGCDDVSRLDQLVGGAVPKVGEAVEFQLRSRLKALTANVVTKRIKESSKRVPSR
jgi:hypothetical protein